MAKQGIKNPLGLTHLVTDMVTDLATNGYGVTVSSNMKSLDTTKVAVRGYRVGPMHDVDVCSFDGERAFWMQLTDNEGKAVGLQAFRFDQIDTNLADWLPNYMIGVYMRRQELMVPSHANAPMGSVAENLRGSLVYHGELWLDKHVKARNVFDSFTRLGLFLSVIKWNPDAVWALTSEQMARHGHLGRIGYTTIERGILRWQWASRDVDSVEYLAVVDQKAMQNIIDEMWSARTAEYPPQPTHN
ncbi:MAG: hypothetical protein KGO94_10505 [Alphaproteobacteria bacterium]|nr:hypothetical protein [Alphaproteobacteria bacterium]